MLLATVLLTIGLVILGALLVQQAANPEGQYAFDFATYHKAAREVADGRSPYEAWMLTQPVPAQGAGAEVYKYPPFLAQLLVPLAGMPLGVAVLVWIVSQMALIIAGVWLAARAGGAPRNVETLLWCAVAATYFLPNFDTVWKGNVSGAQAFQVGLLSLGGAIAGVTAVSAGLLKTTPAILMLPALMGGRRIVVGLTFGALTLFGASFVLSPHAWLDFVRVVPNLIAGDVLFRFNVAPDALLALEFPHARGAAPLVRAAAVSLGVAALAAAVLLARRNGGWPAALALAVGAMLILPSSIWYHYFAVLLPVAALAWGRAGAGGRLALIAGASLIMIAVAWLPLALLGGTVVTLAAAGILWPVDRQAPNAVRAEVPSG
jgi:hypothetical protein